MKYLLSSLINDLILNKKIKHFSEMRVYISLKRISPLNTDEGN